MSPQTEATIDLEPFTKQFPEALGHGRAPVLATASPDGMPDIGPKGSLFVVDKDHLAYLERTHRNHIANLKENPHVAVMFYDRDAEIPMARFFGVAELLESGPERDSLRSRVVPDELSKDPDNKGIMVKIRVDKIVTPRGTVSRS
ncbi:MAG TPA: pyridoxamine 5'-phosphate oxidase family protein [Chloroflexota bacterium]